MAWSLPRQRWPAPRPPPAVARLSPVRSENDERAEPALPAVGDELPARADDGRGDPGGAGGFRAKS